MEIEKLKNIVVHTEEELENMSDDEYCKIDEEVSILMSEFGFEGNWELIDAEKQLVKLRDLLENPKSKIGCKTDCLRGAQYKPLAKINKSIVLFKRNICNELASLIGGGLLQLSKSITYKQEYCEDISLKYLFKSSFADLYDECEEESFLTASPSMIESDDSVKIDDLPLNSLIRIVDDIKNGNATLFSMVEYIAKVNRR